MPSRAFSSLRKFLNSALNRLAQRPRLARFFEGDGPHTAPITLERSRIFVFPTRQGVTFAVVLMAMLLGSINFNKSLGLLFVFLLSCLAVVSILHCYYNVRGLTFHASRVDPVFAGEVALYPIRIDNPPGSYRYALQLRCGKCSSPDPDAVVIDVPRDGCVVVLARETQQRGRQQLGRFTVETRFPLGLFRAWSHLDLSMECLVYPKPGPERPWEADADAQHAGPSVVGTGCEDFAGLRTYLPGDPLSRVHWKATARNESLLTKQFGGSTSVEVWLDYDRVLGLGTEERLSQLCRWVLDAHDAGCAWGLRLPGTEIGPYAGTGHLGRCLTALADFPVS